MINTSLKTKAHALGLITILIFGSGLALTPNVGASPTDHLWETESDSGECPLALCSVDAVHHVHVTSGIGCGPDISGYHCHLTYYCSGSVSGTLQTVGALECATSVGDACETSLQGGSCDMGPAYSYHNLYQGTCITFQAKATAAAPLGLGAVALPAPMVICLHVGETYPVREG